MLEGLCSVVSLSLLLTSNMIQPMARRSYFPIPPSNEAKPPDTNNEDGAIRKYYPMDTETPKDDSFGENNFLGAIIRDLMVPSPYRNKKSCPENQLENCQNSGVFLREKYNEPHSDLLNTIEREEKFDYFRRAEDVMLNPVLPAGTPMNFNKQYSTSQYSRHFKTVTFYLRHLATFMVHIIHETDDSIIVSFERCPIQIV